MMFRTLRAACLVAPLAMASLSATAAEFTDKQREELGTIIRDYLLKNPELLMEAGEELQKRQAAAEEAQRAETLTANAAEIFHSKNDLVAGNPKGSVTMVEFFDYNCAWCKKGLPEVLGLLDEDKNLRLVMKEFPIFGEDSEHAARAALASRKQDKYWPFHLAMLGHEGKLSKADVDEIAAAQGLDMAKLKTDMDSPEIAAVIARNQQLANAMAITGTPAFIVDRKLIPGYLSKDGLAAVIKEIRDAGGCTVC